MFIDCVEPDYYHLHSAEHWGEAKMLAPKFYHKDMVLSDFKHWARINGWRGIESYVLRPLTKEEFHIMSEAIVLGVYTDRFNFIELQQRIKVKLKSKGKVNVEHST